MNPDHPPTEQSESPTEAFPGAPYDEPAVLRARALLDELPSQIGPYRILERLGQGGMGEVYRAEQRTPIRRELALKLIKLGMDTKQVIARFEAERQALALMDHPHIAKVFDAGADETGRPYFAMELVRGVPITHYADEHKLSLSARLELFTQVCQAIQHAHQKGVIHRDLKPSNILVSTHDGRPHAKVIDFGIAKAIASRLTEKTLFTEFHNFIGTPQYMSPEQATGSLDVDTRSDVYSLGVLLYELLTGQPPFDGRTLGSAAFAEVVRILKEVDPPKPSTRLATLHAHPPNQSAAADPSHDAARSSQLANLAKARSTDSAQLIRQVRGELDWMVMKALDKDRSRRYETPTALANDLQRYLKGEPVEAAPPSWGYRATKFVRKHRLPVAASAVVATLLLVATCLVSFLAWQLGKEVDAKQIALNEARYQASKSSAQLLISENLWDRAHIEANKAYSLKPNWEAGLIVDRIQNECHRVWKPGKSLTVVSPPLAGAIVQGKVGRFLLLSTSRGVEFVDTRSMSVVEVVHTPKAVLRFIPLGHAPDKVLALADSDAYILSLHDMSLKAQRSFAPETILGADACADVVAIGLSDKTLMVLSAALESIEELTVPQSEMRVVQHGLGKVAISPDGNIVVAGGRSYLHHVGIWDRVHDRFHPANILGHYMQFISGDEFFALKHMLQTGDGVKHVITRYKVTENGLSFVSDVELPHEDIGHLPAGISIQPSCVVLAGGNGVGDSTAPPMNEGTRENSPQPVRYSTLSIGLNTSLKYFCLSQDGQSLALSNGHSLMLFERAQKRDPTFWRIGPCCDFNNDSFYEGVLGPKEFLLRVTDLSKPGSLSAETRLPSTRAANPKHHVFCSGIAVSENGGVIASRVFEGEMANKNVDVVNHAVLIYNIATNELSKLSRTSPRRIALADQGKRSHLAAITSNQQILALDEAGTRLLVGATDGSNSTAELYDVETGKILKQWGFDQHLGSWVKAVPKRNAFVALSPETNTLRIFSLSDGRQILEVPLNRTSSEYCVSSDGTTAIVRFPDNDIVQYDLTDGRELRRFQSKVHPLAWSANNDVFIGFEDGNDFRTVVLASCLTGESLVTLAKGVAYGAIAQFSQNGRALYCQTGQDDAVRFCRNDWLLPTAPIPLAVADHRDGKSPADSANAGDRDTIYLNSTGVTSVPPKDSEKSGSHATSILRANQSKDLQTQIGKYVTIEGRVAKVIPTRDRRAMNLYLEPQDSGVICWIDWNAKPLFDRDFKGDSAHILDGRAVRVTGVLNLYGGKSPNLKSRLEITLSDPSQLTVLEAHNDNTGVQD